MRSRAASSIDPAWILATDFARQGLQQGGRGSVLAEFGASHPNAGRASGPQPRHFSVEFCKCRAIELSCADIQLTFNHQFVPAGQ